MEKSFYVYMLASKRNGTLYIGMTSDLMKRMHEHREGLADGFTKKYNVHTLVWYEQHETAQTAIKRERSMKEWQRSWKTRLIEENNPEWTDLYRGLSRRAN